MTNVKRNRGRPLGSGGHDDTPYLAQIADKMVADPSMKRSAAMNLVRNTRKDWGVSDKTLLQRWRDKLARQESELMEAARKRATAPTAVRPTSGGGGGYYGSTLAGHVQSQYDRMMMANRVHDIALGPVYRAAEIMRQHEEYERINKMALVQQQIEQYARVERMMRQQRDIEQMMKQQRDIEQAMRWSSPYRF